MRVDADSHFMEPLDWIDELFPALAAQLPPIDIVEMVATAVLPGDDLVANLPPRMRPAPMDLVPAYLHPVLERLAAMPPDSRQLQHVLETSDDPDTLALGELWGVTGAHDGQGRLRFMDEHAIDVQFVLPSAPGHNPYVRAGKTGDKQLARDCLYAWNSWAVEVLADARPRALPVTLIELSDLDRALDELGRMRALGSRCFTISAEPPGRSLAHPDLDRLWSTATDLGMAVMFHTGHGRPSVPAAWADDGSGNLLGYLQMCASQAHQVPEMAIAALIFGGVLERHPTLAVLSSEFGVAWLPNWLERMDTSGFGLRAGYEPAAYQALPMRPSDYVSRQCFVTPLPGQRIDNTVRQVAPGVVQFATDYPHPEGSATADEVFDPQLEGLSDVDRAAFYGLRLADALDLRVA